jgi:hypothetical protein
MGDSSNTTSSAAATAMDTGYNDATVVRRRMKKENVAEAEAEGHIMRHDKFNNKNGAGADN